MKLKPVVKFRRVILCLTLFIFTSIPLNAQVEKDYGPTEILFIGSSYFNFNDLPNLFVNLSESAGKDLYIDQFIPSGYVLNDLADNKTTKSKIIDRKWDFIIIQGGGNFMAYPDSFPNFSEFEALDQLKYLIDSNCSSTRIIYCLPWAFEDGMTWAGWPDTYDDMQKLIYERTLEYSDSIGFTIAPVGWAWYKVLYEKNYPLHYLHMEDWNHPSIKGSYLMACTIFSTIFIEPTIGINFNSYLEAREANYFRTVASNIVLEDLDLWKITPYIDTTYSVEVQDTTNTDTPLNDTTATYISQPSEKKFIMYQNYPNPFLNRTCIKYQLTQKTDVELVIYDLLGNKKLILVNKQQLPGIYEINFDSCKLKKGTYIYCIKTDYGSQSKKMQLIK